MIHTPENLESVPPHLIEEVVLEHENALFQIVEEEEADDEVAFAALRLYEENRYKAPTKIIASYTLFVKEHWPGRLFHYQCGHELQMIEDTLDFELKEAYIHGDIDDGGVKATDNYIKARARLREAYNEYWLDREG